MPYDRDNVKPSSSLNHYMTKEPAMIVGDSVSLPLPFAKKLRTLLINSSVEDEADFLLEYLQVKDEVVKVPLTIASHLRDFLKGIE